jgi:hypothetical protein
VLTARITRISPLELAMRDVRENMADFAGDFGLSAGADNTFTILSIEAPSKALPRKGAQILRHPHARRHA